MKKMYPAVVNSPKTELTDLITESQTDITVADIEVLLTGEGIATIGNGDAAETILYTSVDGNTLIGCVRGFQGVARAWTAGTRVARNFAAADWDAARENILELADRLDTPERASITLQPRLHVVSANQDAAFKLAGLQGRTVLNYQSQVGIFGVLNPYVIRYGANLLPPFYEWETGIQPGDNISIDNPHKVTINATTVGGSYVRYYVPVIPSQQYIVSVSSQGANASMYCYFCGEDKTRIDGVRINFGVITPIQGTIYLEVVLNTLDSNYAKITGTAIFTEASMIIGNTAKPFKPREDSMFALQTELHANPDTGANPDSVFERDGQYFKLAKWRKVVLDGSRTWGIGEAGGSAGLKQVKAAGLALNAVAGSGIVTKFDGKLLPQGSTGNTPDTNAVTSAGDVYMSIPSADSGWGDSYTPTLEEIKAYFMGWKMYDVNTNPDGSGVYNRTDGVGKWFVPVDRSSGGVNALPTTKVLTVAPYQLLYQLATPVVEPITSEGQLTFFEGDNQVEVGTGIVLRESTKPALSSLYNTYEINSVNTVGTVAPNPLKHKAKQVVTIYKNNRQDKWSRISDTNSNGVERAFLNAPLFDPSAAYSVTYLMLDKYPVADFTGTYAENEKALLLDAVKSIQENTTRISVLESKKAEKDAPAWIAPTLLNGWVIYNDTLPVGYYKDSNGIVRFKGMVKSGALNSILLKLPPGYRPKNMSMQFVAHSSDGSGQVLGRIIVNANGDVQPYGGSTTLYSLDSISFLSEQ
ncbi:hypothetical protein JNUCC31_25170 [Paenibacillus sp. JNUCC31]|uniref:hypothetical protein n=1 Tax=Paenibacillus sp. JNUCC-31 TaxID=2777983 RepID=UPI00177D0F8F|nr:hypothetical protein [Paenibacillus sp. JNUCC-31]QOS77956.1 hypothetical protein JNUCC31_24930 [Paenibacillus sp. JNUCC-31]QOS78000.1 hypothetical protein JNUCC31_25170 [Paenibacillus sp. JNUCC-31]